MPTHKLKLVWSCYINRHKAYFRAKNITIDKEVSLINAKAVNSST